MALIYIIARYEGTCNTCDAQVEGGDKVLFDTKDRVVHCEECAGEMDVDEDVVGDGE
jgi:NAD-dependent SIR2 family protein deacetylase